MSSTLNLYIEANFLMEVVFGQPEAPACERLLARSRQDIELILPASAILEARYRFVAREKNAKVLGSQLRSEMSQLTRTHFSLDPALPDGEAFANLLVRSAEHYRSRFSALLDQIARVARIIPLDDRVLLHAQQIAPRYDLELPDALVLASVLLDLDAADRNGSIFVTKDSDFGIPSINHELLGIRCVWMQSFANALDRIDHRLSS